MDTIIQDKVCESGWKHDAHHFTTAAKYFRTALYCGSICSLRKCTCFAFQCQSFINPILYLKQTAESSSFTPYADCMASYFPFWRNTWRIYSYFYPFLHYVSSRSTVYLPIHNSIVLRWRNKWVVYSKGVLESFYVTPILSGLPLYRLVEPNWISNLSSNFFWSSSVGLMSGDDACHSITHSM